MQQKEEGKMRGQDFLIWWECRGAFPIPGYALIGIGVITLALCFVFLYFITKKSILYSLIILGVFGFLLAISIPQFAAYRNRSVSDARSALKNLATAQEGYFLEYDTYCGNANRVALVTGQGWTSGLCYDVIILAADEDSWSATASHIESTNTFTYSSSEGGLMNLVLPTTVNFTNPLPNSNVSSAVNIEVRTEDKTAVRNVSFSIDGRSIGRDKVPVTDGGWQYWSFNWNTTSVTNGQHRIEATAVGRFGKTARDSIVVSVQNDTKANIPPVAVIQYTQRGNKYYCFYLPKSKDSDGSIQKYEYKIIDEMGHEESYSYCETCFLGLPRSWACHKFPRPGTYEVHLTVWDNVGTPSKTATKTMTVK